jgi:hypothetical protein
LAEEGLGYILGNFSQTHLVTLQSSTLYGSEPPKIFFHFLPIFLSIKMVWVSCNSIAALKQSDRFLSHKMFRPRVSSRKTELGPML